mmetsp:Transcript_29355/g.62368  ORF Transcript_29355/g.62368 Transcript_29355/m.62368 type:complete len:174 (+) Transcript_29355:38-559(+)
MSGFITTKSLNLTTADAIASLAIKAAKSNGFNPISVCVMDPAGAEIVTKRMDGCPAMAYPKISAAKANTCVSTKSSSRAYGAKYLKGPNGPVGPEVFARVLNQISIMDGKMAAFQGGILVRDKCTNEIVGSVGVSGAAGDEDEYCALYGVQHCLMGTSLITEPAVHSCKALSK